ncbi:MAG: hypothetical protein CMD14_06170 [Flavobacteriales bacterium]|mgnify:CR=1 FL=1|nr:hypothetical protein [Flavobacteriales bacterium]|tara:strand:- start:3258 stop:4097 length:840 start_codon:yes stop_codon:yes gene_type:complete
MKRTSYIFIFVCLYFLEYTKAQDKLVLIKTNNILDSSVVRTNLHKKNDFSFQNCSFGFGFGLTQFYGDISEDQDFNQAYVANMFIPFKDHFLQAELISGDISAKNPSYLFYNPRHTVHAIPVGLLKKGESFKMEFIELDINFLISFLEVIDMINLPKNGIPLVSKNQKLDLLCKLGVGLNFYRSLRQEITTGQFINSYGYDWMWENDFENAGTRKSSYVKQGVFVLGMIAKYEMNDQYDINFSVTSRIAETDKWDAKISGQHDMYMFYSLGAVLKFGVN